MQSMLWLLLMSKNVKKNLELWMFALFALFVLFTKLQAVCFVCFPSKLQPRRLLNIARAVNDTFYNVRNGTSLEMFGKAGGSTEIAFAVKHCSPSLQFYSCSFFRVR